MSVMLRQWRRPVAGALLSATLLLLACQSEPATVSAQAEAATPVRTAAYVCPMGCKGSESDKPGKCPVCEMELAINPAATTPIAK